MVVHNAKKVDVRYSIQMNCRVLLVMTHPFQYRILLASQKILKTKRSDNKLASQYLFDISSVLLWCQSGIFSVCSSNRLFFPEGVRHIAALLALLVLTFALFCILIMWEA